MKIDDPMCEILIKQMQERGWECDTNTEKTLGFVFYEDENREWIRDYDKAKGTFIQHKITPTKRIKMTDRYYALTVILEKDIRDDDAEPILNAIKMIKGVQDVKPHISTPETWMAQERARIELGEKLWCALYPKDKNKE